MAGYGNAGKARAAKAISGFFKKKPDDEETEAPEAEEAEEEGEDDTLAKRIARGVRAKRGY